MSDETPDLLARAEEWIDDTQEWINGSPDAGYALTRGQELAVVADLAAALRAVLDLHKPVPVKGRDLRTCNACEIYLVPGERCSTGELLAEHGVTR